jgi:nicotinamide riboside transporter PnuC
MASFVAFIILNIIENYIHYNIGRNREKEEFISLSMPTKKDWMKIIIIMIVFAILQGAFTMFLSKFI